ncbi:MAG: chemotaxis response regulator protein-glutamate methylesterase [Haliangiales bacterium]
MAINYTRPSRCADVIDVLIIDDSAVAREVLASILSQEAGFRVRTAADAVVAMRMLRRQQPHVIVLDLRMPRMNGLTFLHRLMAREPIPVVVCSSYAASGTRDALEALQYGAVAIVSKPTLGVQKFLSDSRMELVDAVRSAASARLHCSRMRVKHALTKLARTAPVEMRSGPACERNIVAIGASTGGTEAVRIILEAMPEDAPPIIVVQHMPPVFTAAFAHQLDQTCAIEVKEASHGDVLRAGLALIAPGNQHVRVRRGMTHCSVHLSGRLPESQYCPSIDLLFHSVADAVGASATGVILTGMGVDGVDGLLAMRRRGAATIAQDEASSAIYSMPRVALERGAVEHPTALSMIAVTILRRSGYL